MPFYPNARSNCSSYDYFGCLWGTRARANAQRLSWSVSDGRLVYISRSVGLKRHTKSGRCRRHHVCPAIVILGVLMVFMVSDVSEGPSIASAFGC